MFINPSTDWLNIPTRGGSRTITITTNLFFVNVYLPFWISGQSIPGGVILFANSNLQPFTRSGTVTISGGGISRSFTASQLAPDEFIYIIPDYDWEDIPAAGGTRNVTLHTNQPFFVTLRPYWVEVLRTPSGFVLTARPNEYDVPRSGEFRIVGFAQERYFRISQLPAASPLVVYPPAWNPSSRADGVMLSVSSPDPWTVVAASDTPWLTVTEHIPFALGGDEAPTHQAGTRYFWLSAEPNPGEEREGSVTIFINGTTETVASETCSADKREITSERISRAF